MDDIKDFETFYASRIDPLLGELKLQSNDAAKWSVAGIASIVLAIVCFTISVPAAGFLFIITTAFSA